MCWNTEVSVAFTAADLAAVSMLCYRNDKRDRLYAMAASPIVGQELCSAVLWSNIGAGPTMCNDINAGVSLLVRSLVALLPLTWVVFAVKGSDRIGHRLKGWTKPFILIAAIYVLFRIGLAIASFAIGSRACTYPGPNHHQIWPDYLDVFHTPMLSWILPFLYIAFPAAALIIFMRPRWVGFSLVALFTVLLVPIRLILPLEWQSVWCWASASILVFALAEPLLRGWIRT